MTKMRHILMMSGGKDSTALAVYMRDRVSGHGVRLLRHRQGAGRDLRVPDQNRVRAGHQDQAAERRPRLRPLAGGVRRLPAVVEHALVYAHAQDQAVREVCGRRRGDDVRRHPGRRGPRRLHLDQAEHQDRAAVQGSRVHHRRRSPHPGRERRRAARRTTTGGRGRAATSAFSSGGPSGSG